VQGVPPASYEGERPGGPGTGCDQVAAPGWDTTVVEQVHPSTRVYW